MGYRLVLLLKERAANSRSGCRQPEQSHGSPQHVFSLSGRRAAENLMARHSALHRLGGKAGATQAKHHGFATPVRYSDARQVMAEGLAEFRPRHVSWIAKFDLKGRGVDAIPALKPPDPEAGAATSSANRRSRASATSPRHIHESPAVSHLRDHGLRAIPARISTPGTLLSKLTSLNLNLSTAFGAVCTRPQSGLPATTLASWACVFFWMFRAIMLNPFGRLCCTPAGVSHNAVRLGRAPEAGSLTGRMWRPHELQSSYDVVIVGAGVHGLATAYYLGKSTVVRNVALLDKSYLGGGNSGRNTAIIRSNYRTPEGIPFYDASVKLTSKCRRSSIGTCCSASAGI